MPQNTVGREIISRMSDSKSGQSNGCQVSPRLRMQVVPILLLDLSYSVRERQCEGAARIKYLRFWRVWWRSVQLPPTI